MDDTQIDQLHQGDTLHAKLGSKLMPLFTWQGRDVYPIFGANGEGEGDGDADGEPGTDDTDPDAGKGDDSGSSDTVTRQDFDKLKAQLQAADKNRAKAEQELKKINDSKKDELTKATERAEELEQTVKERDTQLAELRLQNAFLTANTGITWHDPADALALAERQGYLAEVVDDSGKVDSAKLTAKLKELAKAKPHLVKKPADESEGDVKKETPPASGGKVGSKGQGGGKKDGDKLPSRYDKYLTR